MNRVLAKTKRSINKIGLLLSIIKAVISDPSFRGSVTFAGDGFLTTRPFGGFDVRFLKNHLETFDPPVDRSLKRFKKTIWRSHLYSWAMSESSRLEGDMIELGVWWGMFSFTGINYIDLSKYNKKFHLVDAFGVENDQKGNLDITADKYRADIFEGVQKKFSDLPVVFHRGFIPEILELDREMLPEKVCFLSMDLNNYLAEKAGIEYLWDSIVPGGFIYIDDYGCQGYELTQKFYDNFFAQRDCKILKTPFSSALVIKR